MARYNLTIDHTKVSSSLTNFPVFVDLDNITGTPLTTAEANSIRVYKADGTTEVPREIVNSSEMHFKGDLSSTVDTVFVVDIDGTRSDYTATATYGAESVWDSNYKSVHHMKNVSGGYPDSTANNYDATVNNGSVSDNSGGVLDDYVSFTTGAVNTINVPTVSISGDAYVSFWVRLDDSTQNNNGALIFNLAGVSFRMYTTGALNFKWRIYTDQLTKTFGGDTLTVDEWYHLAFRVSASEQAIETYVNGARTDIQSGSAYTLRAGGGFNLGGSGSSGQNTNSSISEVRLSNMARTSSWITTEYANQNSPSTFYTVTPYSTPIAGIKVYDGTNWAEKPVKVWDGSQWVQKPVKRWDGSVWV